MASDGDRMTAATSNGYIIDVTDFIGAHPGGRAKILKAVNSGDKSFPGSHFGATSKVFARACAKFDAQASPRAPVAVVFPNSRANGGLDRSGNVVKAGAKRAPVGTIMIVGKVG